MASSVPSSLCQRLAYLARRKNDLLAECRKTQRPHPGFYRAFGRNLFLPVVGEERLHRPPFNLPADVLRRREDSTARLLSVYLLMHGYLSLSGDKEGRFMSPLLSVSSDYEQGEILHLLLEHFGGTISASKPEVSLVGRPSCTWRIRSDSALETARKLVQSVREETANLQELKTQKIAQRIQTKRPTLDYEVFSEGLHVKILQLKFLADINKWPKVIDERVEMLNSFLQLGSNADSGDRLTVRLETIEDAGILFDACGILSFPGDSGSQSHVHIRIPCQSMTLASQAASRICEELGIPCVFSPVFGTSKAGWVVHIKSDKNARRFLEAIRGTLILQKDEVDAVLRGKDLPHASDRFRSPPSGDSQHTRRNWLYGKGDHLSRVPLRDPLYRRKKAELLKKSIGSHALMNAQQKQVLSREHEELQILKFEAQIRFLEELLKGA